MSSLNNKNVPEGILTVVDPDSPPKLNKVKKRCLMLSPTVNAGLEPESKITDFDKEREIGKGGFGLVWKVIHKTTQKVYCIKVIKKEGIVQQKLVDQMNREIEIMYILNNPHCLRLKNHFEDDTNFYLVMPLASKGQLYRVLKKFRKFDERTAAQILRETISALQYLHSFKPPIIHRDIKPENLLLNEGGRILLADYGWSNFNMEGDVRKTFCGTPEYIAPEMLLKKGHDTRVDIWSIGILMFELLSGYSPFVAKSNQELYQNIRRLKIQWPKDMPPLAKNLISKILKLNPVDRPTFDEILNHQWFKQTKQIKPLLENKMKTIKDLLAFHMLNGCDDETLEKINKLLKLSGKDADNSNAKSIVENSHEKEEVTKKKIITKDIQSIQSTSQETAESIEIPISSIRQRNRGQNESLFVENDGLKKEKEMYKAKLKSIENELKQLKNENSKLKDENTSELQEKVKEKDAQIEKLKIMDKDRIAVLAELEQKNKLNMDLNNQIQMLENENLEKDKTIDSSQSSLKDLNKQIEYKDFTVDGLVKKNNALEQEKENLFIDYQKKIEELQLQVLDSASSAMDSTSGLCKVIDILNSNVDEFKNIFKKKIDNFEDIFDKFKSEYIKRDESFTSMLNDKTKEFHEFINKFVGGAQGDVQNVFNNVNTPTSDIKDRRIDWLNKQVNSLTEYKNKLIELENKFKDLNGKKEAEDKKFKEIKDSLEQLNKKMAEKNEIYEKLKNKHDENEKKFKGMEDFMKKHFKKELIEKYKQQCGN